MAHTHTHIYTYRLPGNTAKNRYKDVICYDDSRVQLRTSPGQGSDYIHANYVDGFKKQKAFILTQGTKIKEVLKRTLYQFGQFLASILTFLFFLSHHNYLGPKDKTMVDFWRMMWETEVAVIVMVTRCVELGKRKCAQYWPESDSGTDKHGGFSVTVTNLQNCEAYDLRTLKLAFKVIMIASSVMVYSFFSPFFCL